MSTITQQIIYVITQAITELLPISSSGHLLLLSYIFNKPTDQTYLTYLHFWTGLAILIIYRNKIINYFKTNQGRKYLLYIAISIIPAGILGFFFDDLIEQKFYNPTIIALSLIVIGILMIFVEAYYLPHRKKCEEKASTSKQVNSSSSSSDISLNETLQSNDIKYRIRATKMYKISKNIPFWKIIIIGLSQAFALIPGVSRSGISIVTGILLGVEKGEVIDLALIMGIPVTIGSFVIKMAKDLYESNGSAELVNNPDFSSLTKYLSTHMVWLGLLCMGAIFVTSYLLRFKRSKYFLSVFGIYRIILGIVILAAIRVSIV